jgi:SAM-dependent methyltransferase
MKPISQDQSLLCPLCGKTVTHQLRGKNRDFGYCATCELIFVPPAYHPTPEEEIHRYRQHQNSLDNPGYVNLLAEVLELIQRFGPASGSLLDYGCGQKPAFLNMCQAAGYEAGGYDPYFYKEPPAKTQFDIISAIEVFEHFRTPATEIRRLCSWLKPGGILAIRTLLHHGERDFIPWWYAADNTHISFYSRHTFLWIAENFRLKLLFSDGEKLLLFTTA